MDWQTFIISVLGSGAATALINGLMNHRTQIKTIKESGLYTKRAGVLDGLMNKMEELNQKMGEVVSLMQHETTEDAEFKRRKAASDAFILFSDYFRKNRHYLQKELSDEIDFLCKEYRRLFYTFIYEACFESDKPDIKKWREVVEEYDTKFVEKREKIAAEFRKIIGVK